jgi:hypothetical protein
MTKTSKLAAGRFSSYTMTIQDNDASVQGLSQNGRNVELYSKEGADEFVDTVGTDFISTHLTATDDQELILTYTLMATVAEHASTEKIASGILDPSSAPLLNMRGILLYTIYRPQLASFGYSVKVS